jgi:hypothetical protein
MASHCPGDPGFGTFQACRARPFGINAAFLPIENRRWQDLGSLSCEDFWAGANCAGAPRQKIKLFQKLVAMSSLSPASTGRELNHPVTMFSNQRLTVF